LGKVRNTRKANTKVESKVTYRLSLAQRGAPPKMVIQHAVAEWAINVKKSLTAAGSKTVFPSFATDATMILTADTEIDTLPAPRLRNINSFAERRQTVACSYVVA
jgi:hypothetical protein